MYELIQAGENTFYMDCPSKVGFYRTGEHEVVVIDSGNDKDAGRKVRQILDAQGWKLKAIFNTHSNADHIGGNQYLQKQTGCEIYARGIDCAITRFPLLEPAFLYGGYPMKELRNKFLMAKESDAKPLSEDVLPQGLSLLPLPGHFFDLVGFRTADNVVFLADCLSSAETLQKYKIGYIYDAGAYLDTLEMVKNLQAELFIPSHAPAVTDIRELAQRNIENTQDILEKTLEIITTPKTFEEVLQYLCKAFDMTLDITQYVLVGNTVRSFLSYLKDNGKASYCFENNRMLWQKTE